MVLNLLGAFNHSFTHSPSPNSPNRDQGVGGAPPPSIKSKELFCEHRTDKLIQSKGIVTSLEFGDL